MIAVYGISCGGNSRRRFRKMDPCGATARHATAPVLRGAGLQTASVKSGSRAAGFAASPDCKCGGVGSPRVAKLARACLRSREFSSRALCVGSETVYVGAQSSSGTPGASRAPALVHCLPRRPEGSPSPASGCGLRLARLAARGSSFRREPDGNPHGNSHAEAIAWSRLRHAASLALPRRGASHTATLSAAVLTELPPAA